MPRKAKSQPRQRGTIIPKGDGKYLVRVYVGTTDAGKREYASKLVEGTISQAQKARTALLTEIDKGTLARPTGETVGDFLPRFLNDVKKNAVQPGTLRGYTIQANTHIIPALGGVRLEQLTSFKVQEWIGKLVDKELSYAAVRHAWVVLDMACEQAVEWNMIPRNPCKATQLPKVLKAKARKATPFSPEQMHSFLAGIDSMDKRYHRYRALVHTLLKGGLRPSEAGALKWSALNLETGAVSIVRALAQVSAGTWEIRETGKTSKSRRTFVLPASVIAELRDHRTAQLRERMASGSAWIDSDFVFTTRDGGFIQPNNMSRIWQKMNKAAGLPPIRLYDTRHTAATVELMAGVDPKTVSERRGHASVAFTLDTYTHVMAAMDTGAASKMDTLMSSTADRARAAGA